MENGLVNLAAIVGTLIVLIGTIPALLFLGTKKPAASTAPSGEDASGKS